VRSAVASHPGLGRPSNAGSTWLWPILERGAGYVLVAPALAIMAGLMVYPFLSALWLSFTQWAPEQSIWLGLANYQRLLADRIFWIALGNTVFYAVWNLTLGTAISLMMALLMNRAGIIARLFRLAIFMPVVVSAPVAALSWVWLLDTEYGLVNQALVGSGLLDGAVPWLNSPFYARWSIVIVNIWLGTGLSAMLFLAALQNIPRELLEAAALDGAGPLRRFQNVVLPLLRPVLLVVLILKTIGSFKTFDQVFIMTGGGPLYRSETILIYLYRHGFEYFDFGYASAVGVLFFLIVTSLSLVQARVVGEGRR
jgi:ABC-type sugar transport system permease subunit